MIRGSRPHANAFIGAALDARATSFEPAKKSMWGYGGFVQAPDGTIWKIATSAKKDTGRRLRDVDDVTLSKRFYADNGFVVSRSFG